MARFIRNQLVQPISSFVPEPLNLYQDKLEDMQKQQDAFSLSIQGLDKNANALVNDIPGTMETKKQVEARLEKLRNTNFNDPRQQQAAMKEISNIRTIFSPFGAIGAREEKLKKYNDKVQEIEKDKNDFKKAYRLQQLQLENIINPDGTPRLDRAIKFDSYGRPLNTEIIEPPDFEYKDKNEVFSTLLKDVTSDITSVNSGLTPERANEALLSYMNGNIEERTGEKIYNTIKQRALADPNLINSIQAEGSYFKQDPNLLFETALQGVANAGKFKKTNVDRKFEKDDLALYRAKKADDIKDANITTSSQSEALPGSLVTIPKEIEDLQFDINGDLKPITKTQYKDVEGSRFASSLTGGQPTFTPTGKQGFDVEANQRAVQLIKNLQEQNPDLQGLKPKQVIEAYKNSIKSLESESIPLQSISNVASKNIGEALSRNKAQRNFYIYDGKGKTSDGQLSTVLDELNIEEADFNKILEKGISGYTQAGPSAGGYYIEVPDSKGNSRRIVISPDAEVAKIFRPSQLINEARKNFTQTEIQPFEEIPNYSIIVKPNITKSGKPNWEYIEVIKDEQGNVVQQNPTSLEDLRETERKRLANSNYLGSQTGILKKDTTE